MSGAEPCPCPPPEEESPPPPLPPPLLLLDDAWCAASALRGLGPAAGPGPMRLMRAPPPSFFTTGCLIATRKPGFCAERSVMHACVRGRRVNMQWTESTQTGDDLTMASRGLPPSPAAAGMPRPRPCCSSWSCLQARTDLESRMRPKGVALPAPAISQGLGLCHRGEQLGVEELVPEPAVERLCKAVLPR
jgi:hypothetical protein